MVMPGDNVTITAELIHPVAMEEGLRFAIREGGRTVGSGRVTKIIAQFKLQLLKGPLSGGPFLKIHVYAFKLV